MAERREIYAAWLGERLGLDHARLDDFRQHSEGFSWQTYSGELVGSSDGAETRCGVAIRRQPEDGLLAPYDIVAQYRLQERLAASTVPVPAVIALELDPAIDGMPFYAMDRVTGSVPVQWDARTHPALADPDDRRHIGERFVDLLADIHALPLSDVDVWNDGVPTSTSLDDDPFLPARTAIDHWERFLDESTLVEVPLLRSAIAWCRRHLVPSERMVLCHGDYRIGNFMVADGDIVAVFDWELAHVGDPVEDLAWAALRLFRGRSPLMSQLIDIDDALARYRTRTGLAVTAEAMRFWTVMSMVKAAAPHLRATAAFESGRTDDLRLAAMGHQTAHLLRHLRDELSGGTP